jgi:hypothetical protein
MLSTMASQMSKRPNGEQGIYIKDVPMAIGNNILHTTAFCSEIKVN